MLSGSISLFLNRELSWLQFNERVLHEAQDPRTPLLERLRFIAILSSNLDEFYMVRVAGLRRQMAAHLGRTSTDGMTAREQVELIDREVREMVTHQIGCLEGEILPALAAAGLRLVSADEVGEAHWEALRELFDTAIFPVLTPSRSTRPTRSRTSRICRCRSPSSFATRCSERPTSRG